MLIQEAQPVIDTLSNGMRVIHRTCAGAVSCCGFVVHAGSRHDGSATSGLAHLTEHLLFKGTTKRKSHHILNRMERVGGELNAYTTKEETFVYAVFLDKDYERALELLKDLMFDSVFPEAELEKEKVVVLDEINSYEDAPSELIFDDFEDLLFTHHPIGRKILGTPDSLAGISREVIEAFHSGFYVPENVVFYSQSAVPYKQWRRLLERHLLSVKGPGKPLLTSAEVPVPQQQLRRVLEKETHQAHVLMGGRNYELNHPRRLGMYLLNNILGGPGMNSRLNVALRERSGLVYAVESNVVSYTDSGVFSIYFGSDPEQTERCLAQVDKVVRTLRERPLTALQLHAAQQQLFGQMMISSENKENATLAMGKSLLHFNHYATMKEVMDRILRFTPSDLRDIANEVMDPSTWCTVIYS
jgi:predicted Zn-dependent peptidase